MLSVILLSMIMILRSTLSMIRHFICGKKLELDFDLESGLQENSGRSGLLISKLEILNLMHHRSNDSGAIDVELDGSSRKIIIYDAKIVFLF